MKPAARRISQSLVALYSLTGLLGFAEIAQAEVTPEQDSATTVNQEGNKFKIEDGVEAGNNQIFSFDQFSLGSDQEAIFNVDANIQNILSRVTGGDLSQINGIIDIEGGTGSTNLFLMNPAGIVFGQGARLDVPGSFTATTATSIGLDSGWFNATGPIDANQLTGNPNNYFAFDTSEPGAIINSADLDVENGNLTLIGGTVASEGTLSTPNGQITIATVPGNSIVRLSQPGMVLSLDIERPAYSGSDPIALTDIPALITGGNLQNATTLAVENGQVVLSGSGIQSGDVVATDTITASTGIDINSNRSITTATLDTNNADENSAGSISLFAQRDITTGEINANDNGDGSAGDVTLYVSEQGNITTGDIRVQNQSEGDAGDVTISTDDGNIDIKNIFAQNHAPTSRPGGSSSVILSTATGSITIEGNIRVKNDAVNQQNPGVTHGTVQYFNPEPPESNSNIDPNSSSYDPNIIQPGGVEPEKLDINFTPATPPQDLITENLPPNPPPTTEQPNQPPTTEPPNQPPTTEQPPEQDPSVVVEEPSPPTQLPVEEPSGEEETPVIVVETPVVENPPPEPEPEQPVVENPPPEPEPEQPVVENPPPEPEPEQPVAENPPPEPEPEQPVVENPPPEPEPEQPVAENPPPEPEPEQPVAENPPPEPEPEQPVVENPPPEPEPEQPVVENPPPEPEPEQPVAQEPSNTAGDRTSSDNSGAIADNGDDDTQAANSDTENSIQTYSRTYSRFPRINTNNDDEENCSADDPSCEEGNVAESNAESNNSNSGNNNSPPTTYSRTPTQASDTPSTENANTDTSNDDGGETYSRNPVTVENSETAEDNSGTETVDNNTDNTD
ncbi:MAG: filamentous hemagglutinin N-terminal domain-containing protein, partial [Coleofasciculus sp. A1-SPW-01]|uniref:two-partner secretion domain-containing protein n=1 Tax=Coleofasciculus sp. A1-SPW-01 TaxID=3070819 RepID=UPI0032F85224